MFESPRRHDDASLDRWSLRSRRVNGTTVNKHLNDGTEHLGDFEVTRPSLRFFQRLKCDDSLLLLFNWAIQRGVLIIIVASSSSHFFFIAGRCVVVGLSLMMSAACIMHGYMMVILHMIKEWCAFEWCGAHIIFVSELTAATKWTGKLDAVKPKVYIYYIYLI